MNNKLKGIMAVLAIVSVLSIAMVSGYKGNYEQKGPYFSDERCADMMDAFNSNDYEAWHELMTLNGRNSKVLQVVNENNFHLFVEAHEAAKAGNNELAQQIRAELGLNNGVGPKNGQGFGKSSGQGEMKMQGQGKMYGKLKNSN